MQIPVEYIKWKDWNSKLNEINKGNRARYLTASIYMSQSPSDDGTRVFESNEAPLGKYYFSMNVSEEEGVKTGWGFEAIPKKNLWENDGKWHTYNREFDETSFTTIYKVTFKFTETNEKGLIQDFWAGCGCSDVFRSIFDYFNPDYKEGIYSSRDNMNLLPKWTTLPKALQKVKNAEAIHKDRYGVLIELGDFVAHPSGSYDGGSWVDISEVTDIKEKTVNGWQPKRLIVVRTSNLGKTLGW